ncbi:MAG: PmoA family protein, partial [Caldilineaceae bacterium]|nr:PmoA family protein [Caldilineaceae bacterium]
PNKWFIRQTPYACASFAFMFDEVYEFEAGETITQRYRLVIANGGWDAAQVEAAAEAWRG